MLTFTVIKNRCDVQVACVTAIFNYDDIGASLLYHNNKKLKIKYIMCYKQYKSDYKNFYL